MVQCWFSMATWHFSADFTQTCCTLNKTYIYQYWWHQEIPHTISHKSSCTHKTKHFHMVCAKRLPLISERVWLSPQMCTAVCQQKCMPGNYESIIYLESLNNTDQDNELYWINCFLFNYYCIWLAEQWNNQTMWLSWISKVLLMWTAWYASLSKVTDKKSLTHRYVLDILTLTHFCSYANTPINMLLMNKSLRKSELNDILRRTSGPCVFI